MYCNVGRKNKLCIYAGRKPTRRRYRRVLYFLAATPYSTTFCRETWHNRVAEAAHAVTFDFSSGFYNRFPVTGCRIRRFLCGIHHRRVLSRRDGFPARLLLYFLCFTSRLYNALPREMSIAKSRRAGGVSSSGKPPITRRSRRFLRLSPPFIYTVDRRQFLFNLANKIRSAA